MAERTPEEIAATLTPEQRGRLRRLAVTCFGVFSELEAVGLSVSRQSEVWPGETVSDRTGLGHQVAAVLRGEAGDA